MCQLLGMNCANPTDFNFSFRGFARRGGETDKHEHGWGLAIYEGRGVRCFHDSLPASQSSVADFVARYPVKTYNMMAHIRYATQGVVSLENVHPFQREMWGILWCFGHNGEVPKYSNKPPKDWPRLSHDKDPQLFYHPVGDTDSEAVFCGLLNALRAEFEELPTLPVLYETIQRFCAEIIAGEEDTTIFNFLLACGQFTLFAYSWPGSRPGSTVWNGLFYTIRRPPFSTAKLRDEDYAIDFSKVTTPTDRVAVIATAPLTVNEEWKEFKRGELLMFDNGWGYSEVHDVHQVELSGHGLDSKAMPKACAEACLRYDMPTRLRNLVDSCTATSDVWAKRGADLGCGSGCAGLAFRSCVRHLTGVDISPEMVDQARARGCYDRLLTGDIESTLLQSTPEGEDALFDIVFACNVFSYIRDIRGVYQSVQKCLNPTGGVFAFSAEVMDHSDEKEEHLTLQTCARFAHDQGYLDSLAKEFGFECKATTASDIRMHEGKVVRGVLTVLTLCK